jgi:probable HAF family extracellular repeat protein
MNMIRRNLLALLTIIGCVLMTSPVSVMAGKPVPPPPPPPVPKLRIQFFDVPNPAGEKYTIQMNNHGQVVGFYRTASGERHAFLYDPAIDAQMAVDLNDLLDAPEGWVIAGARDINDFGAIVGFLHPIGDESVSRGFVCDLSAAVPTVQTLPDSAWISSIGHRINENGDVIGKFRNADGTYGGYVYHTGLYGAADVAVTVLSTNGSLAALNNPVGTRDTQVLGQDAATGIPFRWTRGQGFESLTPMGTCGVYDMNDSGTVCGWSNVKFKYGSGKNTYYEYYNVPVRYTTALQTLSGGYDGELADSINSSGDVVTTYDRLYSDLWGFRTLNSLIDPADPNAVAWNSKSNLYCTGLNDRDATTKCGQVSGVIWWADGTEQFFLLTPVP